METVTQRRQHPLTGDAVFGPRNEKDCRFICNVHAENAEKALLVMRHARVGWPKPIGSEQPQSLFRRNIVGLYTTEELLSAHNNKIRWAA